MSRSITGPLPPKRSQESEIVSCCWLGQPAVAVCTRRSEMGFVA